MANRPIISGLVWKWPPLSEDPCEGMLSGMTIIVTLDGMTVDKAL